jgi:hypothetical protein
MNNEPVAWTGQNTFCKNCNRIPSQCCCTPIKTLTDEEILQFQDKVPYTLGSDLIAFARAILKKASEK